MIEEITKIKEINKNKIITTHNQVFSIFEIKTENIDLKSEEEKEMTIDKIGDIFKVLNKDFKFLSIDMQNDLRVNIKNNKLKEKMTNPQKELKEELENLYNEVKIIEKRHFIIVQGDIPKIPNDSIKGISSLTVKKILFKLFKKELSYQEYVLDDINIYPNKINFKANFLQVDNEFQKITMVKLLPYFNMNIGLLSRIIQKNGVNMSISFNKSNTKELMNQINNRIKYLNSQINDSTVDDTDKNDFKIEKKSINQMLTEIQKNNYPFYSFNIYFQLIGKNRKELNELDEYIKKETLKYSIQVIDLEYQQKQGWLSFMPFEKEKLEYELNGYSKAISSLYPFDSNSFKDDDGIYLGRSLEINEDSLENNRGIFIPDLRSYKLNNSNFFLSGASGSGKSTVMKKIIYQYSLKPNVKLFNIDSDNHEYNELFKNIGGVTIRPGETIINPFEIFNNSKQEINHSLIMKKIVFLKNFLNIYRDINEEEMADIEDLLIQLYKNYDEQNPLTFTDFYEAIIVCDDMSEHVKSKLLSIFKSGYDGTDKQFLNGKTNVDITTHINYDILDVLDLEEKSKQVIMFLFINFIWEYMKNSEGEFTLLTIDELHLLLNANNKIMSQFITESQKRVRKYDSAIGTATQQLNDLNVPGIKEQAKSIIGNSSLIGILQTKGESSALKNMLDLEEHEIKTVKKLKKLQMYGMFEREKYIFEIDRLNADDMYTGKAGKSR